MPKKAGMEKWKKQRRKEYLEKKEYRYYIFCEGEQTEPSPTDIAPGTTVYELVEELTKYLPENIQNNFMQK